jgi:protein ImuB
MFATIYVPDFGLQAATRHRPELQSSAVALIDGTEAKATIIQRNDAAERAGVHCGMTPSQGLARCLTLVVKTRCLSAERAIDDIVLHNAYKLSPYIEATAPGIATVQFTDNRDLGGKLSAVIDDLARCEITAQAGIAATPDLSFLAAHLGKPLLQIDDAAEFLATLAIETLLVC